MTKLEHIQDYKGQAILIYRITDGRLKGTRYFKYGNYESKNIKDIKDKIDDIGKRTNLTELTAYGL